MEKGERRTTWLSSASTSEETDIRMQSSTLSVEIEDEKHSGCPNESQEDIPSSKSLPLRALVFLLVQFFGFLFLFLFSALPFCVGDRIHLELKKLHRFRNKVGLATLLFMIVLYMLDARYWHGCWRRVRNGMVLLCLLGMSIFALLLVSEVPLAPYALFLFGTPFLFMAIRSESCIGRLDIAFFLRSMQFGLLILAFASLSIWVYWIIKFDAWWNLETRLAFYVGVDCNEGKHALNISETTDWSQLFRDEKPSLFVDGKDIFNDELNETEWHNVERTLDRALNGCQAAFLLWMLPVILSIWGVIFAGVLAVVRGAIRKSRQAALEGNRKEIIDPFARAFIFFIGIGVLGMWAAAGISGSRMSMTTVVLTLTFLAMTISGAVVIAIFGVGDILNGLSKTPLGSRLARVVKSDWLRAGLVITVGPFYCLFVLLSAFRQASRRVFACTKDLTEEQRKFAVTRAVRDNLRNFRRWNWGSILLKILWIGVFFFLFVVGVVRVTTLFMAEMNVWLKPIPLSVTTVVFVVVGLVMFLLPPVPGVPVYVAGGVILVANADQSMSYPTAILYTIGICFFIKLAAIALQQKVIGEHFAGKSAWVRSFVGVNSLEIRAIRHILEQPGMTLPKVAILCGGPDWPVSVLTGILKQNIWAMLYGSLPVVLLVAPMVLAGAMLLRSGRDSVLSALAPMMLVLALIIQGIAFLLAVHFIAKTIVKHEDELLAQPDDEEVLALEEAAREKNEIRNSLIQWNNLSTTNRALLLVSVVLMLASTYIFQFMGTKCFKLFSVNDSIEKKLDGNALNLVRPIGWVALGLFTAACTGLIAFNSRIRAGVALALANPQRLQSLNPRHHSHHSGSTDSSSEPCQRPPLVRGGISTRTIDLEGEEVALEERALSKAICFSFLSRNFFFFLRK